MDKHYVYILCSKSKRLKIGYTDDISSMLEEKSKTGSKTLQKYNRLIYYEKRATESSARNRVQMLDSMTNYERNNLISKYNPEWLDVSYIWRVKTSAFDF